jgi:hypothetical protein
MLITFKSPASADVIMFGDAAKTLLEILEKDPLDPKGIITAAQVPGAIARLSAAIQTDRAEHASAQPDEDEKGDDEKPQGMAASVRLYQRAFPLLQMLEYALKEKTHVIWEHS